MLQLLLLLLLLLLLRLLLLLLLLHARVVVVAGEEGRATAKLASHLPSRRHHVVPARSAVGGHGVHVLVRVVHRIHAVGEYELALFGGMLCMERLLLSRVAVLGLLDLPDQLGNLILLLTAQGLHLVTSVRHGK